MKNQTILITGGAGYIGKIADWALREQGFETHQEAQSASEGT